LSLLQLSYAFSRLELVSKDLVFHFQLNEGEMTVTFIIIIELVQIYKARFLIFVVVHHLILPGSFTKSESPFSYWFRSPLLVSP
jgi:hypothetical protein